jgi:hypothetical protein
MPYYAYYYWLRNYKDPYLSYYSLALNLLKSRYLQCLAKRMSIKSRILRSGCPPLAGILLNSYITISFAAYYYYSYFWVLD